MIIDCRSADTLLVLGGGRTIEGELTRDSIQRVETAAEFVRNGGIHSVILSAGLAWSLDYGENQSPEAETMAEEALSLGIPEDLIKLETRSFNTLSNIGYCALEGLFDTSKIIGVITQPYHILRSLDMAGHLVSDKRFVGIAAESRDAHSRLQEIKSIAIWKLIKASVHPDDPDAAISKNLELIRIAESDQGVFSKAVEVSKTLTQKPLEAIKS